MSKGNLFILSGPSGSGKDTILKELLSAHNEIKLSISSITRPMREGEVEGEKYHFISVSEFEKMIEEDAFLEYNRYVNNYYGSPKAPVEKWLSEGTDVILEIDVNGAKNVKKVMSEAISIFIMPPSYTELNRRLMGRGTEKEDVIKARMEAALGEIAYATEYDYIVTNDKLDRAVEDVLHIILAERLRSANQQNLVKEVLKEC